MADYYPLIAKAVAALDKNTGEARRALYERARSALVTQLRGVDPALSESDITRERLALEEAIRKVEGEAARRARDVPRPETAAARPEGGTARPEGGAQRAEESPRAASAAPSAAAPASAAAPSKPENRNGGVTAEPGQPAQPKPAPAPPRARPSLTDQGLKGFRDVIAEADDLGAAAAQAGRSARQAYAAVPSPTPELDRIEPRVESDALRAPGRETAPPTARADAPSAREKMPPRPQPLLREQPSGRERPGAPEPRRGGGALQPPPPPGAGEAFEETDEYEPVARPHRSYVGLIKIAVALGVVLVLAGLFYFSWPKIASLLQAMRGSPTQTASAPPSTRPKISDRVGGGEKTAPVAQRAILYESDPSAPEGKQYVGTALWRTETVSPGPGLPPEMVIRADVQIPERKIGVQWSLRRNTDKTLTASSHTIEIIFNLPPDFSGGSIKNVPGVLMKPSEQARGVPLSGQSVRVTDGYFLIGLNAMDAERNLELLKGRQWFDISILYANGQRAILALDKGTPGERAFAEAFSAWGE